MLVVYHSNNYDSSLTFVPHASDLLRRGIISCFAVIVSNTCITILRVSNAVFCRELANRLVWDAQGSKLACFNLAS